MLPAAVPLGQAKELGPQTLIEVWQGGEDALADGLREGERPQVEGLVQVIQRAFIASKMPGRRDFSCFPSDHRPIVGLVRTVRITLNIYILYIRFVPLHLSIISRSVSFSGV